MSVRVCTLSGTIRDGQAVTSWVTRRPASRRAFGVLDPEGRSRTGISPLDRRSLYQLSYLGVVPEVYRRFDESRKTLFKPRSEATGRNRTFGRASAPE